MYKLDTLETKDKKFDLFQSQIKLLKENDEDELDIHEEVNNKFLPIN